jgi:FtsX-like permease family/MacB-like periplasmic core domain
MRWSDALLVAARELRRRPARCALTVAAVVLAAALLVALLAVVTTARSRVLDQISKGGPLAAISVEPAEPNAGQESLDDPEPGPPRALTGTAVAAIGHLPLVSSIEAVEAAPVEVLPPAQLPAGSTLCAGSGCTSPGSYDSRIVGADLADLSTLPITLLAGTTPAAGAAEVDVGEGYLREVGLAQSRAGELIGTDIELGSERFSSYSPSGPGAVYRWVTAEIVGVVDQQVGSGDVVGWPSLADSTWDWETGSAGTAPYLAAVVVADQLSEVPAVRAEIAVAGYSSSASEGLIVSVGRYIHVVEIVLSGIGIVALIIAALGIANALFSSVRERRNEIGIMKAIGARDIDVLRIFVSEAVAIGLVGGLLGTALGIAIAVLIGDEASSYLVAQGLPGVVISVPWLLLLGGAAGSAVVAFVAGLPAAVRAAHLPAREAVAR